MSSQANDFSRFDLTAKTALVTGGATGIGLSMAKGLLKSGARVFIAARREPVLQSAKRQLEEEGFAGRVACRTVNLESRASITELLEFFQQRHETIDIFIGNAAQDVPQHVADITNEAIDKMVQVNFSANVEIVRRLVPEMQRRQWGRIIFSSSASALCSSPFEGASLYTSMKSALNAFARTAATELGHDGITVNSLILGPFATELMRETAASLDAQHGAGAGAAALSQFSNMTAVGRMAECAEIEGVVQLLASDAGAYITGSSMAVDGGMTIMMRPRARDNSKD